MNYFHSFLSIFFTLQELGPIETANINDALKEVLVKKDFEGIELKANFADNYFPYSFLNDNGGLSGILYDVLNIASRTLNVSLKYQDPLPHNYDIWSKRYLQLRTTFVLRYCFFP